MAGNERTIKLGVDGEKSFKQRLADISLQAKVLDSEMKAVTSSFTKTTSAEEKIEKATEVYNKQIDNQQARIKLLSDELERAKEQYGENSEEVAKLQISLNNATRVLNSQKNSFSDLTETVELSSGGIKEFSSVFVGNLLANLATNALSIVTEQIKKLGEVAYNAVRDVALLADDLNTLSKQTGVSTETLQEWNYASDLLDVSTDTLTGSMTKLLRNMDKAVDGSGDAYEAFKELDVAFQNDNGTLRDKQAVFFDLIDALGQVESAEKRDVLAMTLFGKSAKELNPLIISGSSALQDLRAEAHEVGYVLSQDTLDSLNEVNDNFDRLSLFGAAMKEQIAAEIGPILLELSNWLLEVAHSVDWVAVGEVVKAVAAGVVVAIQILIETVTVVIDIIKSIVDGVQWVAETLPQWWDGIVNQVNELKTKITDKFTEIIDKAKTWGKDMVQGFIDGIKSMIGSLGSAVSNIASTISSKLHFSRPDEGPLRDYETWMPDFMQGLAKGIEQNTWRVQNAMAGVTGAMVVGGNGAGSAGRVATINLGGVTFNGYTQAQGRELVALLNKELGRLYQ